MTNAPDSRKTHITRILGTNKNGDVLQDIWADVERIDVQKSASQTAEGVWQGVQRKFLWSDDPDRDGYVEDGTHSRDTIIVKVCSPDAADINDPDEWIPIRVNKSLKMRGGNAGDQNYQDRILNDELNHSRKVRVRRIVHYDTNIDDAAQAAFDADPTRKAYVVDGKDYTKKDGSDGQDTTKDDGQYVEYEIIEYVKHRNANNRIATEDGGADVDSGLQTKLLNQYLIDESDDAKLDVTGLNGINPPYRLDPGQNIINVNLGALAVEFGDKDQDAP